MGYTETEPLISSGKGEKDIEKGAVAPVEPVPIAGEWAGHGLDICGLGSEGCNRIGALSCLVATYVPCLAFGFNVRNALRYSLLFNALLYFGCFFLVKWLWAGAAMNAELACQPLHLHPQGHPAHIHPIPVKSCQVLHNYWKTWTQGEAELLFDNPSPGEPPLTHPINIDDLTPECHAAIGYSAGMHILAAMFIWAGMWYAAHCRKQIRERFNIPGSALSDFACWVFCPLCALCQETRTLLRNRVQEGVWQGPLSSPLPVAHTPPFPQTMPSAKA